MIQDAHSKRSHGRISSMKRNFKRWLIWLGLIISVIFLFIAFRKIDYTELWGTLKNTRLWWLLPGLLVYFFGMLVRTWRWGYLLKPLRPIKSSTLFPIIIIGYMGNNVFPLRIGEVLRSLVLKKHEDVSISGSLATIVVERIFDAVVIMGFVLLNLGQLTGLTGVAQLSRLVPWGAAIFLIGLILFILIAIFPNPAARLIHGVIHKLLPEKWQRPVVTVADKFLDGLKSLRSAKDVGMIFLTSVLVWLLETGLYWSVNQAMGLDLNFQQLMLLNGVVNMVLLIPAAPGGLGTFDAAGRAMLEAFGIASEPALGFTLILRIALWLPITLIGAVFFFREGLKLTMDMDQLQEKIEKEQD